MYHIYARRPITYKEGGMFGSAKTVTKGTAKKGKERTEVVVPGISDKLREFNDLKDEIASREARLKVIDGEIRSLAKDEFLKLYERGKAKPESFNLVGDKGGCIMVVAQDRYLMVKSEADALRLKESYGDVVDVDERFYFNNEVLERNREAIEEAVMSSEKISKDDKENLVLKEVKYSIKKGMIGRLHTFGDRMREVFLAIAPVFNLKNCGGEE